jgi:hypothetical protein
MPPTGRVTLRHQLHNIMIDVPKDNPAAKLPRPTATPQVEEAPEEGALETTARKGGEAR